MENAEIEDAVAFADDLEKSDALLSEARDLVAVTLELFHTEDVSNFGKQYASLLYAVLRHIDTSRTYADALIKQLYSIKRKNKEKEAA